MHRARKNLLKVTVSCKGTYLGAIPSQVVQESVQDGFRTLDHPTLIDQPQLIFTITKRGQEQR